MSFDKGPIAPSTEKQVSRKTASKIGLFGAVSIIIGSTVGVGIFFKNNNVFSNNNGNPWGVLCSWLIAFVIAFSLAFSFGEIVTCKTKSANSGLAGWSERFCGYRWGRIVKIAQPIIYFGIYVLVDAVFFGEAIFNCFTTSGSFDFHIAWVYLVAMAGTLIFVICNILVSNVLQKMSNITTILKFIPLGLVIFSGIIFGCISNGHNLFAGFKYVDDHDVTYSGDFSFAGMINSLPAILFAFDSFLIIGNIQGEMENPKKNVPLSMVISMICAGVLYILVTIGQICVGCGSAYAVFDRVFVDNEMAKTAFHYIISIFIFIAIFGVLNSMTMGAIRSMESAVQEEVIIGSKWMKKVGNGKYLVGGAILLFFIQLFFFFILGIPSLVMNTDQIFDGASNFIVLLFFGVYAVLAGASVLNRKTNKVNEITKQKGQIPLACIGTIGCLFLFGYGFFYQFLGAIIEDPFAEFGAWGLFHKNPFTMENWLAAVWFWVMVGISILIPLINDLLIKLTDKNYNQPLIWQKTR